VVLGAWLAAGLACGHKGQAPSGPVIKKLTLEGTEQISAGTIKEGIATAATGWWWPFAKKQYFDPFTWQSDLRRIERIYQAHGYYQARILSERVKQVKGGVELTANIGEGKPTRIGSLDVQGLEDLPQVQRHKVLDRLGVDPGTVFLEASWESAKNQVRERLRNLGFAEVTFGGRALVDVKTQQASLLIRVELGPRYRFGEIKIDTGQARRIKSVWIWDQVRLAIAEGEVFSDRALAEAQRRVFGMGVFVVAKVAAGPPDKPNQRIPIAVEVREAPLRTLRVGGGVQIDQVRNEARLRLEWSHLDFWGGMRKLTFRAEAGWAFIPSAYAVARDDIAAGARNGPIARSGLQLEQPRFFGRPSLSERSTIELERTLEQSYDSLGGRLSTGVVWQPWSRLSIFATYNLQGNYLNGPVIAGVSAAPLTLGCSNRGNHCFVLLSYLEQILMWDNRDAPLDAHRGYYSSLSFQEGGGPLGGDFAYLRIMPDLRGYLSLGGRDQLTFATRLRVGELFPSSGPSAVVTRLFAGGGVSMRGFSDRRLSPLLLAPAPASTAVTPILLTLPIGGNGSIEGNFEIRYHLTNNLVVAAFLDFGQVTEGYIGVRDVPTLLWALGLGLRYETAIGPIRVDLARRLPWGRLPPLLTIDSVTGAVSPVPYAVNDSCFGLGGSGRGTVVTDSSCVLHLAIGEAF
jgi:translocation and assembly module TamA